MSLSLDALAVEPTVQAAAITGLCAVLVALTGVVVELLRRQQKAIGAVKAHAEATRDQVQNSHGTNLRDDVDKLLLGVDDLLDGQRRHGDLLRTHSRDIGGLREEIRHERAERLDIERRLNRLTEQQH
jgi:hypothetical protein